MGDRTRIQLAADRRVANTRRSIGTELRTNREDQGISLRAVARAAGVDPGHVSRIESGSVAASLEHLERIAGALGGELSLRFYPATGSALRDRYQSPIAESLVRILHPVWKPSLEVLVQHPARGIIDVVLARRDDRLVVASEIYSQLRRLEQLVRWGNLKRESLPSADLWRYLAVDGDPPTTSSLLVLRTTDATRSAVAAHSATLASVFPVSSAEAFDSLTAGTPWPGAALLWADVSGGIATLRRRPPKGVGVGR